MHWLFSGYVLKYHL